MAGLNNSLASSPLNPRIDYYSLGASQDHVLPTGAGIKAGQQVLIFQAAGSFTGGYFTLTIKASNGSVVDTIMKGRAHLVALQDNPTTPAHWGVIEIYEEGSWTPILGATTSDPTITYSTQAGLYVRQGEYVTVNYEVSWSAGSGGTGTNALLRGLPYNTHLNRTFCGPCTYQLIDTTGYTEMKTTAANNNGTVLTFAKVGVNVAQANLAGTAWTAGGFSKRLTGMVTYKRLET